MKKILSLLSVLTLSGATMSNIMAISNYQKEEKFSSIMENFELETPITKVTAFYFENSNENTFVWTKKLPIEAKYKFFSVKLEDNSKHWGEGADFNYFSEIFATQWPYMFKINIPLVNNTEVEETIVNNSFICNRKDRFGGTLATEVINSKLILNLKYSNNLIIAKFLVRSSVKNTSLFSWVKTQAKFYFKIIISQDM